MRDILVFMLIFGSLPFILRSPFIGVVVWTWVSLMNPHRLAWGFTTSMPLAQIVAITLLISYLVSREPKKIPVSIEVVILTLFVIWMFFTTTQAIAPAAAWQQWDKVWKIQLAILVTLMLTTSRFRIHVLVWTICVSLGFYGFKGGIWVLLTGGAHQVYGPPNTFIGGNNELGLALIMIVPLLWYLINNSKQFYVKLGLYSATIFTLIAIVGTHSRGALLGLGAMGLMFVIKSRRRFLPIVLGVAFVASVPYILPEEWFERMHTIENYEQDNSAMERIRAWGNAMDLAAERFYGGGYDALIYYGGRDAHSIYFEVLGEHGYVGLALFLALGICVWFRAGRVRKMVRKQDDMRWAADLMSMIQVTLIGYAAAGAFLGLAYFDLIYVIMVLVIASYFVVLREIEKVESANDPTAIGKRSPVGLPLPAKVGFHGAKVSLNK